MDLGLERLPSLPRLNSSILSRLSHVAVCLFIHPSSSSWPPCQPYAISSSKGRDMYVECSLRADSKGSCIAVVEIDKPPVVCHCLMVLAGWISSTSGFRISTEK